MSADWPRRKPFPATRPARRRRSCGLNDEGAHETLVVLEKWWNNRRVLQGPRATLLMGATVLAIVAIALAQTGAAAPLLHAIVVEGVRPLSHGATRTDLYFVNADGSGFRRLPGSRVFRA